MSSDADECESNPCQHGGTCEDGKHCYTCTCAVGYIGVHCEIGQSHILRYYTYWNHKYSKHSLTVMIYNIFMKYKNYLSTIHSILCVGA